MQGLWMLLFLSTIMGTASFLAGMLPLSFSMSASQLRTISTIGMGVLVGTALIVIIPEGIDTLYEAGVSDGGITKRGENVLGARHTAVLSRRDNVNPFNALPGPAIPADMLAGLAKPATDPPKAPTTPGRVSIFADEAPGVPLTGEQDQTGSNKPNNQEEHGQGSHYNPHAWVGVSLISGFILMYLIDTLSSMPLTKQPQRFNVFSLSELGSSSNAPEVSEIPKESFSTTLGLVIHATADGIALGASSSHPSMSFIIFLAIMVHKAPAAFGLTSVLLKQGLNKRQARIHLILFSVAAPIGAIITWILVSILGGASGGKGMQFYTGLVLLFSGGTFLYVAMHTMQEQEHASKPGQANGNGSNGGYLDSPFPRDGRESPSTKLSQIGYTVLGMLLPLITQIGHTH